MVLSELGPAKRVDYLELYSHGDGCPKILSSPRMVAGSVRPFQGQSRSPRAPRMPANFAKLPGLLRRGG